MDSSYRIVYATEIEQDTSGYRNDTLIANTTYDFQALLPDNVGSATETYYFYVEISG
jgi:hypothetical protein